MAATSAATRSLILVTGKLDGRELIEIIKMERDIHDSDRILWPFQLRLDDSGAVTSFTHRGKPVAEDASFIIAFNCFDAQSASKSMMPLREILSRREAKRRFTGIETRNALIRVLVWRAKLPSPTSFELLGKEISWAEY